VYHLNPMDEITGAINVLRGWKLSSWEMSAGNTCGACILDFKCV